MRRIEATRKPGGNRVRQPPNSGSRWRRHHGGHSYLADNAEQSIVVNFEAPPSPRQNKKARRNMGLEAPWVSIQGNRGVKWTIASKRFSETGKRSRAKTTT